MSVYATIAGEIQYPDLERYEEAKQVLRSGGWIDEDDSWVDENGNEIEGADKEREGNVLSITIPAWCHRNLLHVLGGLTAGASSVSGQWASTDGMFAGGDLSGGDEIDLGRDRDLVLHAESPVDAVDDEATEVIALSGR